MNVPLDEVIHFDAVTSHPTTGAATDADSTPTFAVYEEATDTDIGVGGNLTKRTSLTGNYRGTFTLSAANGFEVGKWYSIIASATVNSVAGKAVVKNFRVVAAEAIAGKPKADMDGILGTAVSTPATAGILDVNVKNIDNDAASASGTVTFPNATLASTTNITAGTITTVTTTTTATNVTTVNGLAAGVITATSIAADAITAAKIANGAIDAATFAADVDAEILSYLVDDATRIDASALNTAAVTSIPAILDDTGNTLDAKINSIVNATTIFEGTADSGSTTTLVDAALTQADADYWVGNLVKFTSGTLIGQTRLITDFVPGTDTITFSPATTQAVSTHTYVIIPAAHVVLADVPHGGSNATITLDQLTVNDATTFASIAVSGTTTLTGAFTATNASNDVRGITVSSLAANVITAASIATGAIDADALATDAVTEINQGKFLASGTIGSTGNDTTHLHLTGLTYGNDEINSCMLVVRDVSESEYHARWIEDWADAGDLVTVATLPFTPQNATDQYWILPIRADVTGGSGLDAAGVRAAIGLASANLDTQLGDIPTNSELTTAVVTTGVRLADSVTHGGSAALLQLKTITVTADSNSNAVTLQGSGTGSGLYAKGGATGAGFSALGGTSSGSGINASGDGDGHGLTAVGAGSGARDGIRATGVNAGEGLSATGGATGSGALFVGGASTGHGLECTAPGTGNEVDANIVGNITGTLSTVTTLTNLPAITANWLTAAGTHSDFTTEIQTGLATAASIAALNNLSAAQVTTAVWAADVNANDNTVGSFGDFFGQAYEAVTVDMPTTLATLATQASVTTIDDLLDTEVAAIKTVVDSVLVDTTQIKADLPTRITKNTELAAFPFTLVLSSDHITGATGKTVTATRSIDGGSFASCANAVAEIANGWYKITLAAADLNGNTIALRFTATACDDRVITIVTQP